MFAPLPGVGVFPFTSWGGSDPQDHPCPVPTPPPVSLGGKSLTPDNDYANPFVAALSSDGLMADFLRLYPVRHSKDFGVSILNIGVGSDALWLASYSKGALMTKSGKTVSTENWTYAGKGMQPGGQR